MSLLTGSESYIESERIKYLGNDVTAIELSQKVSRRLKSYPKRMRNNLWRVLLKKYPDALARIVKAMADTGEGTDACLRNGAIPMPVHFYSPIPDISELETRDVWNKKSAMAGIDLRSEFQVAEMHRLGALYGSECDWPKDPTADRKQFYTHNGSFSYGCAAALHTRIRDAKPARIIEVGSGNSSKVISKALMLNASETSVKAQYTIIDPYPNLEICKNLPNISNIIAKQIELCDPRDFEVLEENDILFIDSSHVVKVGSDVNFLILDVLPRLKPGVIIHFHDISLPYEYPKAYATNPQFRVFWNEAYLLQAFMACNADFEILQMMNYLQVDHMDEFRKAFPKFKVEDNWANSGSFWIRKKPVT